MCYDYVELFMKHNIHSSFALFMMERELRMEMMECVVFYWSYSLKKNWTNFHSVPSDCNSSPSSDYKSIALEQEGEL